MLLQLNMLKCIIEVAIPSVVLLKMGCLKGRETTSVECGRFYFVPNAVKVAQGLIEVLYNLRNALFHGEINPNGDANKVYGAAYHLLRRVIECL